MKRVVPLLLVTLLVTFLAIPLSAYAACTNCKGTTYKSCAKTFNTYGTSSTHVTSAGKSCTKKPTYYNTYLLCHGCTKKSNAPAHLQHTEHSLCPNTGGCSY